MKEGWTYKKLGEIYPIIMGKTPPRNITRFWDTNKESHNLWVSIADLSKNEGKNIYDTKEYITDEATKNITKIPKGSLLVSFKLTLGKMAFAGTDLYTNEAIMSLNGNKDYNLRFLYYYFSSLDWGNLAVGNEKVKGKTLNKKSLAEIPIVILSLEEQQTIVEKLDSAFTKIDALKKNAEKNLENARALFQKVLAEEMTPKEGWEDKSLKELTSEIGDGLHGTPNYSDDGNYFFVNGNNLENGFIEIKENTKRVSFGEFEKYKLNLNSSTVFLSINGTIGKTAFYNGEPIILGKSACYINVLPTLLKEFLRYYLISDGFMNYAKRNSRQATITNLGLKEIRNMPIFSPSLSEQQAIVEKLDALSEKVRQLEENQKKVIAECDNLKQAILKETFE